MTDKEIIKALECCSKDDCDNCPNDFGNCYSNLAGYALNIIKRQQAEIEKNEKIIRIADKTIETQNAEIKRLNTLISKTNEHRGEVIHAITHIDEIKSEAVKEFAEKVKNLFYDGDEIHEEINKLVKEMVGEQLPLNDVKCKDCGYLELELPYAVCSKAYKGIVAPDDSCGKGKTKEMVGNSPYIDKQN